MPAPPLRPERLYLSVADAANEYASSPSDGLAYVETSPGVSNTSTQATVSAGNTELRLLEWGTGTSTTRDPRVWQGNNGARWGWTFRAADWFPTDSRGRPYIESGDWVFSYRWQTSGGGALNLQIDHRIVVGVFRWDGTTATKLFDVTSGIHAVGKLGTVSDIVTKTGVSEFIFERDEYIVFQMGCEITAPGGLGGGDVTTTWTIADADAFVDTPTPGFRIHFNESDDVPAVGTSTRVATSSIDLNGTGDGTGAYTKDSQFYRQQDSIGDGVGVIERLLQAFRQQDASGDGEGILDRIIIGFRQFDSNGDGIGSIDRTLQAYRQQDGSSSTSGIFERVLQAYRQQDAIGDVQGIHGKLVIIKTPFNIEGIGTSLRTYKASKQIDGSAEGSGNRIASAKKLHEANGSAAGTIERSLIGFRQQDATGEGTSTINRVVVFTRGFDATAEGSFTDHDLLLRAPVYALPTPEGGTTIVRNTLYIFDD